METVENKYITVAYKLYSIENGEKDFEEEDTRRASFSVYLRSGNDTRTL